MHFCAFLFICLFVCLFVFCLFVCWFVCFGGTEIYFTQVKVPITSHIVSLIFHCISFCKGKQRQLRNRGIVEKQDKIVIILNKWKQKRDKRRKKTRKKCLKQIKPIWMADTPSKCQFLTTQSSRPVTALKSLPLPMTETLLRIREINYLLFRSIV